MTIQWRRVWPRRRRGQSRILGNGKQLANKLAEILPPNFLVRLIDTAVLPYKEQISVMRSTDYLIGIHGAGLSLSIFLPKKAILQEIYRTKNNDLLTIMSTLSGHLTYSDYIKSYSYKNKGSENVYFDEKAFGESVLTHMKENNYF